MRGQSTYNLRSCWRWIYTDKSVPRRWIYILIWLYSACSSALSLNINPIPLLTLPAWLSHACWLLSTAPRYIHDNNNSTTCASRRSPISMWGNALPRSHHSWDVGQRGKEWYGVARDFMRRGISLVGGQSLRTDNIVRIYTKSWERNDGILVLVYSGHQEDAGFLSFCLTLSCCGLFWLQYT